MKKEDEQSDIVWKFFQLALPATVGVLANMLIVTINLVFIGHLNDTSKIASCGLGNILIFIFATAAYIGMNSGMESLVSQAFGAKNLSLCGQIYQRGRIVIMLYWLPLTVIMIIQGGMLKALGQKPKVIEQTQLYLMCMLPSTFLYGLNDLQNKFLIQMDKAKLILGTQSTAILFHIVFNYLFVKVWPLHLIGCSIATTLTYTYIYFVNRWKLRNQNELRDAMRVSILDPKVWYDIGTYISIGLPNMITLIIEFISYEVTIIYLGQIGIDNQATQILLLNFFGLNLMLAFGYQQASCALVGQCIGANNVFQAKTIWLRLLFVFISTDIVLWCFLYWNRMQVASLYTSSQEVLTLTNYTIWITIVVIIECFMKNSILGIIKALEQQKSALCLNLFIYLVLTIPLAYVFGFEVQKFDMLTDKDRSTNNRGVGIWIAFVIGAGLQNIGYFIIITKTDWWRVSHLSQERLKLSTQLLPSKDSQNDEETSAENELEINKFIH